MMNIDNQLQPINNACAFAVVGAMARKHPRANFVSAEFAKNLLQTEGEYFSLKQVQASFRQLQEALVGVVIQDTSEQEGFEWALPPCIVYESLRNGPSGNRPVRTVAMDAQQVESLDEFQDPLRQHVLQLRGDCVVHVSLPKDFNKDDAEKLTHFLTALVGSEDDARPAKWPFESASALDDDDEDWGTDIEDVEDDEFPDSDEEDA